jgi:hypothetical protein
MLPMRFPIINLGSIKPAKIQQIAEMIGTATPA